MKKSYEPVSPKPMKFAPEWTEGLTRRTRLRTTDAEFQSPYVTKPPHRGGFVQVAYQDGRGRWYEVAVHAKSIKEVV